MCSLFPLTLNGAQYFNSTRLLFLSVCHAAAVSPVPTTVMVPLIIMYASYIS